MAAEKQNGGKKKALILLIGFFALIAVLTILSTIADSFTVAKVSVAKCSSDSLNFSVSGTGKVVSADNTYQYGLTGLRIRQVLITEGVNIAEGDSIAMVDMADLEQKLAQARQQTRKLEIQLAQADLTGTGATISQAATDTLNQKYRHEDLLIAEQDLKKAQEKLITVQERSQSDLLSDRQIVLKEARISYYSLVANYDSAVDPAEQAWKDAKDNYETHPKVLFDAALKGLGFSGNGAVIENELFDTFLADFLASGTDRAAAKAAVEAYHRGQKKAAEVYAAVTLSNDYATLTNEAAQLKKQLDKAKSSYDQLKKLWDQRRNVEQMRLDNAEEAVDDITNGNYDNSAEVLTAQQAVDTASNRVKELHKAIELGEITLQQNQATESNARRSSEEAQKARELTKESISLDLENQRHSLAQLQTLLDQGGTLSAQVTGTVEKLFLSPGQRVTEDGILSVNTGGYYFEAELPQREAKNFAVGDTIRIRFPGKKSAVESEITGISISANGAVRLTTDLPEGSYLGGANADFEIVKRSDNYDICIPLSALRQNNAGYYVMTVETRNTILGDQLAAISVPVTVLDQDNTRAAVEFSGSYAEYVILSSNKDVGDGDRVRIVSE